MENQTPPQAPTMAARPWFRLTSMRASETPPAIAPPAPVAAPPRAAAPPPPATERPLVRLGSLLSSRAPTAVVPPPQQEPTPPPPQTQPPTPPPTVPTAKAPPRPPTPPTPLATAVPTQEQQPPSQALRSPVTPSPVVRQPSPPAPPAPQSLTVMRLPETTPPPSVAVSQQPPTSPPPAPEAPPAPSPSLPSPPVRTLSPPAPPAPSPRIPSPPVRTLFPPAPPAPSPRLPSPPPHPEPETKPVVSVVTSQSVRTPEPASGLYKDRINSINGNGNGNGGKTNLGMTQGEQLIKRVAIPHLPSATGTPKKADPAESAAVPGKKKSGSSDEAESRMRVLTLAGGNVGAYMNLGSGIHRGNTVEGHGRHLPQSQKAAQIVENVSVARGSNGTGDASPDEQNYSTAKDVKASTRASRWKAGAASAKPMAALVNSNVQSVNNSIMFNSSCTQHSPGVYITLSSGSRRLSSSLGMSGDGDGNSDGKIGLGKDNARADH